MAKAQLHVPHKPWGTRSGTSPLSLSVPHLGELLEVGDFGQKQELPKF